MACWDKQQVAQLKDQTDILVAVTHLFWNDDCDLAVTVPEIDLILGGYFVVAAGSTVAIESVAARNAYCGK